MTCPKQLLLTLIVLLIGFSPSFISAQESDKARIRIDATGDVHPWNHLGVNKKEGSFQFAIATDRTGGHRPGIFPDAIHKLNLLQPEFVMSVGDLIEGYTEDEARIDQEWEEFTGFIDKLEAPFFYLPGNHDYINPVMARKWKERFGRDYYHFVYEDVLFLCLNSEEKMRGAGRGYIDSPQLAFIEETLKENAAVRWTFVFLHQPLWDQEDNGKWAEVEALLADRKHTVFAGHRHRYVQYERNNSDYIILATTGGGSGLRGARFGEFDHVMWVTMTDEGPILANLLLEGIWDKNVQTEDSYAFARPLMGSFPMEVEPLFVTGNSFSEGSIQIKVKNDSDVPLQIDLAFTSAELMRVESDKVVQVIAPNSVEQLSFPIKTDKPVAAQDIKPIQIQATATYLPETYPELQLQQHLWFRPQSTFQLESSKKKIVVDGDLKDWKNLRFTEFEPIVESDPFSHKGSSDASFSFDIRQKGDFIYLAAMISDDQIEVSDAIAPFDQDGISFLMDPRPVAISAKSTGYRSLVVSVSPSENLDGPANVYRRDRLPDETEIVCKRTETGYVVEAAFPISAITRHQGEDWKHLRLNVALSDTDKDGAHTSTLFWQADWRGEDHVLGSGTFLNQLK